MRGWLIGLFVIVAATIAVGVGLIVIVTSTSTTALTDLEVGDCFQLPSGTEAGPDVEVVETVEVIACDEPHDAEVIATGELNADGDLVYPSDLELFVAADDRCNRIDAVPRDRFGIVPIVPTERTWTSLGGWYACVAIPFGGATVTGSITDG